MSDLLCGPALNKKERSAFYRTPARPFCQEGTFRLGGGGVQSSGDQRQRGLLEGGPVQRRVEGALDDEARQEREQRPGGAARVQPLVQPTGRLLGADQPLQRRQQPADPGGGDRPDGRVAQCLAPYLHGDPGQPLPGVQVVDGPQQAGQDLLDAGRLVGADGLLDRGVELLEGVAGQGRDELVLAAEVAVDQPGAEPRGLEEVLHRGGVEAVLGKAAPGRLKDLAPAGIAVLLAHTWHGRRVNGTFVLDNVRMEAQALNEGGFIAGPDGAIDWAAPDEELMRFHNEQTRQLGARLCGRGLYQDMLPASSLVELDLIDEYRLFVSPVVLGGGTRGHSALALSISATGECEVGPPRAAAGRRRARAGDRPSAGPSAPPDRGREREGHEDNHRGACPLPVLG